MVAHNRCVQLFVFSLSLIVVSRHAKVFLLSVTVVDDRLKDFFVSAIDVRQHPTVFSLSAKVVHHRLTVLLFSVTDVSHHPTVFSLYEIVDGYLQKVFYLKQCGEHSNVSCLNEK